MIPLQMDPALRTLADACREYPTAEKRVVLRSLAQGRALGERLAREGRPWLNLRFTTPMDLARELAAAEMARLGLTSLHPEAGPAMAGALLYGDLGAGKPYFRRLAGFPGIAAALWSALSTLRLASLAPKDLKESAFVSRDKGREMRALLAALERELERRKLADGALLLSLAAGLAHALPPALTLEDASAAWTERERGLLEALPGERRLLPFPAPAGLEAPRRLRGRPSEPASGRLGWLFDPARAAGGGDLSMFHAAGHDAEVHEVLRRVLAGGIPFDQVEIVCASVDPYTGLFRDAAARLGIPLTLAEGLPLSHTRPGRALGAFCRWAAEAFPRDGLMRLLQSGDVTTGVDEGPGSAQVARLLLASGAGGGGGAAAAALRAQAARERSRPEEDSREGEAERAEGAARFVESLSALVPEGEEVDAGTVFRGCRFFLQRHAAPMEEADQGALEEVRRALEALEAISGPPAPPERILAQVEELLAGIRVQRSEPKPGSLHLTSLASAAWSARPETFVVGLDQGALPGTTRENPVLLDAELKALHPSLATGEDRSSEALYLGAGRLGAMPGRVTLSYTARDLRENRELYPASILLQAHRLELPGREDLAYGDLLKRLGPLVTRIPALPGEALDDAGWWLSSLRDAGEGSRAGVLAAFPDLAAGEGAPAFAPVPSAGEEADPRRSGKTVSPSALEQLARCGRQFFFRRILRLPPAPAPQGPDRWLDPMTRGSLLHQAYADFLQGKEGKDRDAGRLRRLGLSLLEEIRKTLPPPSSLVARRESEAFLADLEYFREEEGRQEGRIPVRLEAPFGPWVLDLGKGLSFSFRGRIDRIDRIGTSHEVVDYKTGRLWGWERRQACFEGGLQLQHALYARAAEGALGLEVSASSYYFPTREGHAHRVRRAKAGDAALRAVLEPLLDLAAGGLFAPTAEEKTCRHCEYRKACPAEPFRDGKALRDAGAPEPLLRLEAQR